MAAAAMFLDRRDLWDQPPPDPRSRIENNPTLLFTWWCTTFSAVIILTRICGRKVRSNRLFREDWIMLFALIPLFIRMALIHVVLLWGTNNIQTLGHTFSPLEIDHRSIGSRLVLAARIFYAAYIWTCKLTVSEFLKRITIRIWRRSYELTLQGIRIFLFLTFFAVVIATLAECHPFDHWWQVVPDPGPFCRFGFANLITMGTCDIVTDILLIVFPIPIIIQSGQTWKRKFQLAALFSLSLIMVAVTATRVPEVIAHAGRQQYRTVWASAEILAATGVANGVILGSFLRDKGTKKNKFRSHSITESLERSSTRRPTIATLHQTDSDEDLFRALGCRVPDHLKEAIEMTPRPAQAAPPASATPQANGTPIPFLTQLRTTRSDGDGDASIDPFSSLPSDRRPLSSPDSTASKRHVGFFDMGGLLEDGERSMDSRSRSTTAVDSGAEGTLAYDFAPSTPDPPRRGSHAFLHDVGGLFSQSPTSRPPYDLTHVSSRDFRGQPLGVLPRAESQSPHTSDVEFPSPDRTPRPPSHHVPPLWPGPPPSASPPAFAALPRQQPPTGLQDVGGLLTNPDRPDDAAASAWQRTMDRPARRHESSDSQTSSLPGPRHEPREI